MALGIAAQLPDSIQDHMKVPGRAQRPGPVTGQVECLSLHYTNTATQASQRCRAAVKIPGPYTVLAITYYVRGETGDPVVQVHPDSASTGKVVSAGTKDILTDDLVLVAGASDTFRSGDSEIQNNKRINEDGTLPWLCIMVTNTGAMTTTDLAVTVWYYRHQHINSDTVDD